MMQMGVRMYSPQTGRFLSVDPLFELMPGQNPYHYAFNSPLIWRDPSGMKPEKEKNGEKLQGWEFSNDIATEMIYKKDNYVNLESFISFYFTAVYDCNWNLGNSFFGGNTMLLGSIGRIGFGGGGGYIVNNGIGSQIVLPGKPINKTKTISRNGSNVLFQWCGKAVNVKYNSGKISAGEIQAKITQTLEDMVLADDGGVIARMPDFKFNLTMTAKELKENYEAGGCYYRPRFMGGNSSNIWKYADQIFDDDNNSSSCKEGNWDEGWIYLANDYFFGSNDLNALNEINRIFDQDGKRYQGSLLYTMSHEVKHRYDALFQDRKYIFPLMEPLFHAERSANEFMFKIFQYYNPGHLVDEKRWRYK
jgi:hypothetical protein